ncbi:lactoylglutathione lyase family protein [Saccharomonospora marina XMU15]|uniref:Lactoylglutathione lyase family protein n=1 Tax=Saccharomonospora marina XMU15 TaxID=882083 RepID=H5WXS1_9PSEU|nr:VOC family protein [Saccharomonospora marina]EHR51730.1 lactoylglutathione lyase family protein [Saccharomonospora marina XMU15]
MPRPVHFEIHTGDPERAIAFYTALFDWSFERWGPEPYWSVTTGEGQGIDGGLLLRSGPPPDPDSAPGAFPLTMEVPDIDLLTREVVQAGGTVASEKSAIPGVGWLVHCRDPEGNLFGMLEPDPDAGERTRGVT